MPGRQYLDFHKAGEGKVKGNFIKGNMADSVVKSTCRGCHGVCGVRLHPSDARVGGIKDGDIVRLHNDRGSVLCIAGVTERMRPGVVHCYYGSGKYDPLEPRAIRPAPIGEAVWLS